MYGFFVAHGIGTKKDFMKGVSIICEIQDNPLIDMLLTDIGIYYSKLYEETKDKKYEYQAFEFFEKAFNVKETKATINNYGICFLKGFGVQKDVHKAKEIFKNIKVIYHLAFIVLHKAKVLEYKKDVSSGINHTVAIFYIGVMKYKGHGCVKNSEQSYKILKNLAA